MTLPSFRTPLLTAAAALFLLPSLAEAAPTAPYKAVQRGLQGLVAAPGGPPGAVATIHRRGRTTVLSAGRSDVRRPRRPRATDHMRIASVARRSAALSCSPWSGRGGSAWATRSDNGSRTSRPHGTR